MITTEEKEALAHIKPIIFGEKEKRAITKGEPILSQNPCVFCEEDVWISSIGYTGTEPLADVKISPEDIKGKNAAHKICFFALANQVFPALLENVMKRYFNN